MTTNTRLKRACDSCRRSKIKCDAAERYPQRCSNCAERRECTFVDGAPKKKHTYAYVQSLEERLENDLITSTNKKRRMSSEHIRTHTRDNASDSELSQLVESMWLDDGTNSNPKPRSENLIDFGMSSNKGLFALVAGFIHSDRARPTSSSGKAEQFAEDDLVWKEPYNNDDFGSAELVYTLVESYFKYVNPTLPLFPSRRQFIENITAKKLDRDFGSVLILVCALGSLYRDNTQNNDNDSNTQLFDTYLQRYISKCPDPHLQISISIYNIQAIILAVLAMQNTQKYFRSCWSLCGLGVLLTENTRLRRLHTEESKRALWCLYVLDKSFAASYGRRALMAPLEIECPTTCDDEGINIVSHFNAMIKLYGIVGDVVDMFYAVNGSTNVDDLNEKLDSWRNNYISTTQLPSQFECLKVIGYNVVKIFINKKSLTSTSHNLEICVEAAKTILSTLHYMHCESELVVTYTDALLNWSVISATGIVMLKACRVCIDTSSTRDIQPQLQHLEIGMRVLRVKSRSDGVVRKALELFEQLIDVLQLHTRHSTLDASVTEWLGELVGSSASMSATMASSANLDAEWIEFLNEIFR
ncbi:hypothetical protein E3Q04_04267 [Wallemia mellicola]|nr:hypothetical protein E3Q04_04267 [Wallemia mellicola]